jgi:hypothetical protein
MVSLRLCLQFAMDFLPDERVVKLAEQLLTCLCPMKESCNAELHVSKSVEYKRLETTSNPSEWRQVLKMVLTSLAASTAGGIIQCLRKEGRMLRVDHVFCGPFGGYLDKLNTRRFVLDLPTLKLTLGYLLGQPVDGVTMAWNGDAWVRVQTILNSASAHTVRVGSGRVCGALSHTCACALMHSHYVVIHTQ